MIEKHDYAVSKEFIMPVSILETGGVSSPEVLLREKEKCVSFADLPLARLEREGSYVLLDFGKEICGGIRIITRGCSEDAAVRLTFGESVGEALSNIGEKNASNDHSPRDFKAKLSAMSDLCFGETGFRFVKIQNICDNYIDFQNVFAVNNLPFFEKEAVIKTSDRKLNKIIETAVYTLKLCLQKGYIWDGIKRDRLIWCGDLHPEVKNSLYLFGDNINAKNSLTFLRNCTSSDKWINNIPSYSAWWVINLCDYLEYTGNTSFFEGNREYAKDIFGMFNSCISRKGEMKFCDRELEFFLDWPTKDTPDAEIGTAAIIVLAAKKFLLIEEDKNCREIIEKLSCYLEKEARFKQTLALQILAGGKGNSEMLEKDGAKGLSTFMAYYILTADCLSGGENMTDMIKTYYGGMLSKGATTFWEDFDLSWLQNSSRIDKKPSKRLKDIHGDFGNYCYKGYRHSLCHGWSSGVLAFIIEGIFGIKYDGRTKIVSVTPHKTAPDFTVKMPIDNKWLKVTYKKGNLDIKAPKGITIK